MASTLPPAHSLFDVAIVAQINAANCPYINWRNSPTWRPLPAEKVQVKHVPSKAIEGARKALAYHEQQEPYENQAEETFHQEMITYYRLLLECWETSSEKNQSGE